MARSKSDQPRGALVSLQVLLTNVPKLLQLVWQAASGWLIINLILTLAGALIPVGQLYVTKLIVDRIILNLNNIQGNSSLEILPLFTPSDNLIVFVGKKIDVSIVDNGGFNTKSRAKYEVLQMVYGDYRGKTIEFDVYDHYGYPSFGYYDTVLLYVSRENFFQFIHEKYQYQPLFKTTTGKWAGCGDPYRREPDVHRGNIQSQKIDFEPLEIRNLKIKENSKLKLLIKDDEKILKLLYPPESFEYMGNTILCKSGNFPSELFEVKRQGVLKARGIF